MFSKRAFRFFDWMSCGLMLTLLSIGLLFVYSSTYTEAEPFSPFFKKQLIGACVGLVIYVIFSSINVYKLSYYCAYGFIATIILLIYTHITGSIAKGGKRWINLPFLRFQPSDLARLFLGPFVATIREDSPSLYSTNESSSLFVAFGAILFTFFIVRKQPDLGSALIILFSGIATLWIAGLSKKFIITLVCCTAIASPILWKILKPYQRQRIMVVLGYGDKHKERYHIEQSKIAIGSGGLYGKGFLRGTQNKFEFLPEDHTDFIFSVICEEWGFVGALCILILFALLFTRIIVLLTQCNDLSLQIVATGLLTPIMLSVCINIGMVTGLLPIVGIPLPLLSYGLTNLWVTLASLGWINNITRHRYKR